MAPSMTRRRTTHLAVTALEGRDVPATGLGIANDFSAFVLHDLNVSYSDIAGRAAVGGNGWLTGYALGDHLPNSHGTRGPNLDEAKPSVEEVVDRVTNGGGGMPSFKSRLSTAQIQALAEYVSSSAGG